MIVSSEHPVSDTFQYAALAALRERELQERANANTDNNEYNNTDYENNIDASAVISSSERGDNNE